MWKPAWKMHSDGMKPHRFRQNVIEDYWLVGTFNRVKV